MATAKSQAISIVLHALLIVLLLLLTSQSFQLPPVPPHEIAPLAPFRRVYLRKQERSGGSNQTALPARRGVPPPAAHRTFIPPISLRDPKLPIPITVAFESSPTIDVTAAHFGDPASDRIIGSLGTIGINGIGDHCCGPGVGDHDGGRPGIDGGARFDRKTTPPQLIYKVEPEFSEAARKAKYQGVVVLSIEVDLDGRAKNLRVIEPLGLGLDEKAIEAVAQWRFRPGSRDGKPVVTTATVEVNFRLM